MRRSPKRNNVLKKALMAILALVSLCGCGHRGGDVYSLEFVSMGTTASVKSRGENPQRACEVVKEVFAEVERLLNAHDADSELSRLAKLSDEEILLKCSPLVRPCYEAAFKLERETGGAFSPRWRGVGTLDLGAIAKGYAVDLAVEKLREKFPNGPEMLVDLGGNLRSVSGEWTIGLHGGGETFVLKSGEAVATSGEYFRGKHIKNARTGGDIEKPVYSVSVIYPESAMMADALSTVMFILGREKGEAFLKAHYPSAKVLWIGSKH